MKRRGTVFQRHVRRCPRDADGRIQPHKCHGPWAYAVDVQRGVGGRRRQLTKSGFATKAAAAAALRQVLDRDESGLAEADRMTVRDYLETWLAGKRALRATTQRSYRIHLDRYLLPYLGHLRLIELRPHHLDVMYDEITRTGRLSAASVRRIHATLRSALNTAVKRRLIPWNPALHIELESPKRVPVTVWTSEQVGRYLAVASDDRLHALYHLVAMAGLRRGEVLGLRLADVDLDRSLLHVSQQLIEIDGKPTFAPPKTRSGIRTVPLDPWTVDVIRKHLDRRTAEREAWGEAWNESGLLFTFEDGTPLRPDYIYRHFRRLARAAGLPPIRLHDLRHTSATLALAAGVPMKVVSDRLGHSTTTITADLYTHVTPTVARDAADKIADLVRPHTEAEPVAVEPADVSALLAQRPFPRRRTGGWRRKSPGQRRGPPGDRTQNPRIKSPLLCQLS